MALLDASITDVTDASLPALSLRLCSFDLIEYVLGLNGGQQCSDGYPGDNITDPIFFRSVSGAKDRRALLCDGERQSFPQLAHCPECNSY